MSSDPNDYANQQPGAIFSKVSTINDVIINLAPSYNVPSINPATRTLPVGVVGGSFINPIFGMAGFPYNGGIMNNINGYSWNEPSYNDESAVINCSEMQNPTDIPLFTNLLDPNNTTSVDIGSGYYDSNGNFGPVGSYGLAGIYGTGFINPYTTLNVGGISTFPTAYSVICGVVIKYILPKPSNFVSLNISAIYPNSPTYVFIFGTNISYQSFGTWVQIGGPFACDFSTKSTNTLTLNNVNDYTAFALVFPTIANPNGVLSLTSIQWIIDVDLISFNPLSLIKYATNNLILNTNAIGIYSSQQTEIGKNTNVLNLNKLALTYNGNPRHVITVNVCGESTVLTQGLSYSFAFPETIRFKRPPMSYITTCDSSITAYIKILQNGGPLQDPSNLLPVGGSNGNITNLDPINYSGGWLAQGGTFVILRGDIITIVVDHLTGGIATCSSAGLKISFYES